MKFGTFLFQHRGPESKKLRWSPPLANPGARSQPTGLSPDTLWDRPAWPTHFTISSRSGEPGELSPLSEFSVRVVPTSNLAHQISWREIMFIWVK